MSHNLPLLPLSLLQRHHCAEPVDTRFRAVARLRQSLWRKAHGFPSGKLANSDGVLRRLGSRLTPSIAARGVNIVDPAFVPLVHREVAYREIGAFIQIDRLWTNLLASQPLTFSMLLPLKQDLKLASSVFSRLLPDLVATVTGIVFEHSPGRGDPAFTDDATAFDALVCCTTPSGQTAAIAIELKYSEAPAGITPDPRPRWTTLSHEAGVFREPDSPQLRAGGVEQFWREQLLLTALLQHSLYERGRLVVIAPALNRECQRAITLYQRQLLSIDPAETNFENITLERFVAALAEAGAEPLAAALTERYLNFKPVHDLLAASFVRTPETVKPRAQSAPPTRRHQPRSASAGRT